MKKITLALTATLMLVLMLGVFNGCTNQTAPTKQATQAPTATVTPSSSQVKTAQGEGITSSSPSPKGYKKISAKEAKEMIDTNPNIIILDVRSEEEYNEVRIPDSLLIPDYDLKEQAPQLLADKDATILVYCRTGRRSAQSAKTLMELGYTNVYDIGGIVDWEYETEPKQIN